MRAHLEANYAGKRVLVTGDTGFKGAWLAFWLAELGAEVSGLALPPEPSQTLFGKLGLDRRIAHRDVDIRDADALMGAVRDAKPEFVFHLAAQSLVRPSYAAPKETFDTNIGGSVNLLEAVRAVPGIRALIYVTSDKCYRNREWVWGYREDDPLGGRDPYSASKAGAEIVLEAYWQSFFEARGDIGIASVRAGNVIGGGDWAQDRLVPDCMRALAAGQDIVIRSPTATRPWQHVLEPLGAYLRLAIAAADAPDEFGGAWNIGPEPSSVLSVRDVTQAVIDAWGVGALIEQPDPNAPHEAAALSLTIEKIRHGLGWSPIWDAQRAIAETVAWYRADHDGKPADEITRKQIETYMSEAA